jgi:SAM-dependent methyltransferase
LPGRPNRTPLEQFDRLYEANPDPWGYATSGYEQSKYDRTLSALGDRNYHRALELGASIGVFTERLAERCEEVVALEPAGRAVAEARRRLNGRAGVTLIQGAAPEDLPPGPFDLVLCSEVLAYLNPPALRETLAAVEDRLAPGGTLLAVHYRGPRRPQLSRLLPRRLAGARLYVPLSGPRVHKLLRDHTRLTHTHGETHDHYLLDRFDDRR